MSAPFTQLQPAAGPSAPVQDAILTAGQGWLSGYQIRLLLAQHWQPEWVNGMRNAWVAGPPRAGALYLVSHFDGALVDSIEYAPGRNQMDLAAGVSICYSYQQVQAGAPRIVRCCCWATNPAQDAPSLGQLVLLHYRLVSQGMAGYGPPPLPQLALLQQALTLAAYHLHAPARAGSMGADMPWPQRLAWLQQQLRLVQEQKEAVERAVSLLVAAQQGQQQADLVLEQPAPVHPALEPYLISAEGSPAAFVIEDYAPQGASTQGCERVIFTGFAQPQHLEGACFASFGGRQVSAGHQQLGDGNFRCWAPPAEGAATVEVRLGLAGDAAAGMGACGGGGGASSSGGGQVVSLHAADHCRVFNPPRDWLSFTYFPSPEGGAAAQLQLAQQEAQHALDGLMSRREQLQRQHDSLLAVVGAPPPPVSPTAAAAAAAGAGPAGGGADLPQIFRIEVFAPRADFACGGAKVLVVGQLLVDPAQLRGRRLCASFGGQEVPAQLLASGAIRCWAPPAPSPEPGAVRLCLTLGNGRPASNWVVFGYSSRQTQGAQQQAQQALPRLEHRPSYERMQAQPQSPPQQQQQQQQLTQLSPQYQPQQPSPRRQQQQQQQQPYAPAANPTSMDVQPAPAQPQAQGQMFVGGERVGGVGAPAFTMMQLEAGEGPMPIHRDYSACVVEKELGSGAYGVTKLLRDTNTGERFAVKLLPRGYGIDKNVQYVERELVNHMKLTGHPCIVAFQEAFLTPTHLCIAMEYAPGGELFDRVMRAKEQCKARGLSGRALPEAVARYFFQQLVAGLEWCHARGVCHRDLKLENALLDRPVSDAAVANFSVLLQEGPVLKLCDFGYSKSEMDSQPKSVVGTPAYIAPELLSRKQYVGEVADVWSAGVLLYAMLAGAYPFQDPADPRNLKKTITRLVTVTYTMPANASPGCQDLISRIFVADPTRRINLAQIRTHPWFLEALPAGMQGSGPAAPGSAPRLRQTQDDIRRLVQEARVEPGVARQQDMGMVEAEDDDLDLEE